MRYSVRGFIVSNGQILLQSAQDGNGNPLIDSCGSFIEGFDDKPQSIADVIKQQINLELSMAIIKPVAHVFYTIHKPESANNQVDNTVFIITVEPSLAITLPSAWKWYKYENIPYDLMYPDVRLWLPRLLAGEALDVNVEVNQGLIYAKSQIINETIKPLV